MADSIAVILDSNNKISSIEAGTVLLVYSKESVGWKVIREVVYSLDTGSEINIVRENIRALISSLEDCKVVVGKTIAGLSYNCFERLGFEIYEAEAFSEALLEEIRMDLENGLSSSEAEAEALTVPTAPYLIAEEGVYFLNLVLLQNRHPEISSKKALQTFIESTPFYRLEVICSHVPPWFDVQLPQKGLSYSVEKIQPEGLKVSIIKESCKT